MGEGGDPRNSAFFPNWTAHRGHPRSQWPQDPSAWIKGSPSHIEGIGRPVVEPSFIPAVVDRMISVPDAASIAAMRLPLSRLRHRAGPSTGTNLWGALRIVAQMLADGEKGGVVMLMCDRGERYMHSYYDDSRVEHTLGLNLVPYTEALEGFLSTGESNEPVTDAVPAARRP